MEPTLPILVCFAVKEESRDFEKRCASKTGVRVIQTGIGPRNAEQSIREALQESNPGLVITSGFAGALNPEIAVGTVVFDCDPDSALFDRLLSVGARSATFESVDRVLTTASEKRARWTCSHTDAVDMESATIRGICAEASIPSATIRVISDAADEDLPLDFNSLMDPKSRIRYSKLAWRIVQSPALVIGLIRFARTTGKAARNLSFTLDQVIAQTSEDGRESGP